MKPKMPSPLLLAAAAAAFFAQSVLAMVEPGAAAPAFTAIDSHGKTVSLADFKGRTVVLEWTNDGCPFVKKHYNSANMQGLQKSVAGEDIVWLSVISSAPGKQGYADGARANELTQTRDAAPAAVLLDPKGELGRLYEAQTSPHMFIVDAQGKLAYNGAIDDKPSTDVADVPVAKNFVKVALAEMKQGKPVSQSRTKPYGCSIKY